MAATHVDAMEPVSAEITVTAPIVFEQAEAVTLVVQSQISPAKAKSIAMSRVRGGTYVDLRKVGNTYTVRVRNSNGRLLDIKIDATTGRVK
jgi:uncharacterized membrane protein YkoI